MSSQQKFTIFLCGDVMTGRGIDQILSHPSQPTLYEHYVQNACEYLYLAENKHGQIPHHVRGEYLWGDCLIELNKRQPNIKIVNLETSITTSNTYWLNKGINYRMHPQNIDALTSAGIDMCCLANNHVLDWGVDGLIETLDTLNDAQIQYAGAGKTSVEAQRPAIFKIPGHHNKLLIFSMGCLSSGISAEWAATSNHPGVWFLDDLSMVTIEHIKEVIESHRKPGDLSIISIHWGSNWGYQIPLSHQQFAHMLIDELDVTLVYGHSTHHPIGIEVYKGRPILYGCGDLINDYEGIEGWETYRSELAFMYFMSFNHQLQNTLLELVPVRRERFSLHYASDDDCQWLYNAMVTHSREFNTEFKLDRQSILLHLL
jgi:poly-gamma-glutamate capsule biosynthesis protein CapA/YwtB (metallophosphatase superfamily)